MSLSPGYVVRPRKLFSKIPAYPLIVYACTILREIYVRFYGTFVFYVI